MPHDPAVLARLQRVFDSVFLERVNLAGDLTAHDVTEWDSLMHVKLILAVEREFAVRFTLPEINAFENVGDLLATIQKKLEKSSPAT